MSFSVIVLAAGQGTRMRSARAKVLHELGGKPMLHHVLRTAANLSPAQTIVVCGHQGAELQTNCKEFTVDWVWQEQQLGTGHAVQCAQPVLANTDRILVLYGDVPLIKTSTLQQLLYATPPDALGILTTEMSNPTGLGRILRDKQGRVTAIVEEKDATNAQRDIKEINSGIYILPAKHLGTWLSKLQANNQQQELYLTDIIALAVSSGVPILAQHVANYHEVQGVNSPQQLAQLERVYQLQLADELMQQGVKLFDPARLDIRGTLKAGQDVSIDINAVFEGEVELGDNVVIGPNVVIRNSIIAANAVVYASSVIDGAIIGEHCQIGPFARVRSGSQFAPHSKIGNFVEIKNSTLDQYSKINHLSYIGDSEIGKRVNIGAGVITCNYDGAMKHKTIIKDDVFVGSNCELIAPVTIGEGATLGAGTTLTKDAPARTLTLSKKILTSIVNWPRPTKPDSAKQKEEV